MAYKCLFMDDDIYTAQDVNDAISNIILGGVSGYPFGTSALTDLNAAIAELANGGVDYKGTSCLVINDGGVYKVSEGSCIMNDGSQIVFDANGYEITPEAGTNQYVYLERDVLHNTINVVVSAQSGGQDTIPLAEIKANGTILDRRRFASAKISLSAEPQNISITKRLVAQDVLQANYEIDLGFNGWKYIICRRGSRYDLLEINNGETITLPIHNGENSFYSVITRANSKLIFNPDYQLPYDVEFEVR